MEVLPFAGLGIIAALVCVMLRQLRPEYAMLLSVAAGVFILLALVPGILQIIEQIQSMTARANVPDEYIGILLKAVGICFVTQISCDTCKDAGENAISAKIEMAGKIAVLIISLPLFERVLGVVQALIQ